MRELIFGCAALVSWQLAEVARTRAAAQCDAAAASIAADVTERSFVERVR
jgi:hypothetical protein